MVAKRKVRCNDCNHEFESAQPENKVRCQCGSMNVSVIEPEPSTLAAIDKKKKQAFKQGEDGQFHFNVGAGTSLTSDEMKLMEYLINSGIGEDPKDVLKKGLYALASSYKIGGGIMQNPGEKKEVDNPEKEMDKLEAMEVREVGLQKIKERLKRGESLGSAEIMEMVKTRQALKMLKELDKEDGDFGFKEMLQMQLFQSMTHNKSNNEGSEVVKAINELKEALRESKQEEKMKTLTNTIESKFNAIESKLGKPGSDDVKTLKEFMLEIETIRERGRTELEKSRTETQTEKELRQSQAFEHKLENTERKIEELTERAQPGKSLKTEIEEVRGAITALKEVSKEFGEGPKKGRDAGDVITEIIDRTTKNLAPIADQYIRSKAPQYHQPPAYQPPPPITEPPNPPIPEETPIPEPLSGEEAFAHSMYQHSRPTK